MKDNRSLLWVLILLASGLVGTWIYHLIDKNKYINSSKELYVKDSLAVAQAITDSIKKIYKAEMKQIESEKISAISNADSLKDQLSSRLSQVNKLKTEINNILQNKDANRDDLKKAESLIIQLGSEVADMKTQNISLEDEKKRLTGVMAQLSEEVDVLNKNMQKLAEENKELTKKINDASIFAASNIQLRAIDKKSTNKDTETKSTLKADRFVISFIVQNNIKDYDNAEVVTVLTDPKGKVVMENAWDSGSFRLKNGERKDFTRKIKFEYHKKEAKNLFFSVQPEDFGKGTYKLQLYHNGILIGQASSQLS